MQWVDSLILYITIELATSKAKSLITYLVLSDLSVMVNIALTLALGHYLSQSLPIAVRTLHMLWVKFAIPIWVDQFSLPVTVLLCCG